MASTSTTTPAHPPPTHHRTSSHTKSALSRPTTPLRPPSRTSLRASQTTPNAHGTTTTTDFPLASLEGAFAEFGDSMADLEANFMHLQLLNESLGRFNENFGAFLYGMNMSAFCVDFPEAPIPQSFARHATASTIQLNDSPFRSSHHMTGTRGDQDGQGDIDATFLTTDTSFVENPPMSSKPSSKFSAPPSAGSSRHSMAPGRGQSTRGRVGTAGGRGTRGGIGGPGRGASGVGRGVARGRGSIR
ncbi:hypothetical protein LTR62_001630 [Meristemomyces frigidus]|uniref:DASH complex subunit DAM1 n=1 Tax=Meristemomyces frigidus TaxID=1508187 RepID=A0AAN7YBJ8_9PEZI|nr:hypothetical protein LTR62_001630 [Meristemomyces frigidus]